MNDPEYKEWLQIFSERGFGNPRGEVGKGWWPLITSLLDDLKAMGFSEENLRINQVKEKFSGLRFYVSADSEHLGDVYITMTDRIHEAEHKSYLTCEACGQPGVMRDGGWYKTLCDTHANGRKPTSLEHKQYNFRPI